MGLLQRLFGKRSTAGVDAAGHAGSSALAGKGSVQTDAEQQATRARMEQDLDAQRSKRSAPPEA